MSTYLSTLTRLARTAATSIFFYDGITVFFPDGPFCNRTLDRFGGCWPDTLPGQFAQIPCPDIFSFNRKGLFIFSL